MLIYRPAIKAPVEQKLESDAEDDDDDDEEIEVVKQPKKSSKPRYFYFNFQS